mmetsp:Transcript_77943/g.252818  ORF Transcript_77943/g.252818 Transcript_77943/m.252818 type:complete len:232 (+) Transcript_77943:1041-1736(+)
MILQRLHFMVSDFEGRMGDINMHALAGKQWALLKTMVHLPSSHAQRVAAAYMARASPEKEVPRQGGAEFSRSDECSLVNASAENARREWTHVRKKVIEEGVYTPPEHVRSSPLVVCQPQQAKVMQCSNCTETIISSWFYVHPISGAHTVLTPTNGHFACRRLMHRACRFRPQDGSAVKLDIWANLDFCVHLRLRYHCADCGGRGMCSHGMQRNCCKLCDHQPKHRRRKLGT